MPLQKVLHKIRNQLGDLTPLLEVFVEPEIEPTVDDCERLQEQLISLQEHLAVYKHTRAEKDSAAYELHARISEQRPIDMPAPVETTSHDTQQAPEFKQHTEKETTQKQVRPLSVNLNDKFRFINELFSQNNSEYLIAMEQLNNLRSWNDTEIYLNSLKNLYEWKENAEMVKYFYTLVRKRFE